MRYPFAAVVALAVGVSAVAADPTPPATLMTKPGKLLLADDLSGPLGAEWNTAKGKWEASEGAVRGAEIASDMHGAVTRRKVEFTDAVIELTFKLDGANWISISLNGSKGHISRVALRPKGINVLKDDQDGKKGPDKVLVLGTKPITIQPGEWHTLVFEVRGPELLAHLDGKSVAYGQHESVAKLKANLGLTVAGQSAYFKNLRVWAAEPNPAWSPNQLKSAN